MSTSSEGRGRRSGPKGWTTQNQRRWLTLLVPIFLSHRGSSTLGIFWRDLYSGWYQRWPDTKTPEERADLETRLKQWYNNHTRGMINTVRTKPLDLNKRSKRKLSSVQAYSRLYYERTLKPIVGARWQEYIAENPGMAIGRGEALRFRNLVIKELFDVETEDVKAEVERKREEGCFSDDDSELDGDDASVAIGHTARRNARYHKAQVRLRCTLEALLEDIQAKTGLVGCIILGGPEPQHGGELTMMSVHSGEVVQADRRYNFSQMHCDWRTQVEEPFATFLNDIFPRETLHEYALATRADQEFNPQNQQLYKIGMEDESDPEEDPDQDDEGDVPFTRTTPFSTLTPGDGPSAPSSGDAPSTPRSGDTPSTPTPASPGDAPSTPRSGDTPSTPTPASPGDAPSTPTSCDARSTPMPASPGDVPSTPMPALPGDASFTPTSGDARSTPIPASPGDAPSTPTPSDAPTLGPAAAASTSASAPASGASSTPDDATFLLCDEDWPAWFSNGITHLRSISKAASWVSLLSSFIKLEVGLEFVGAGRIDTVRRPSEVATWLKNGRNLSMMPNISNPAGYLASCQSWWYALQPQWRKLDGGNLLQEIPDTGEDWSGLRRGGKNGFYMVILAFSWWVTAVGGDVEETVLDDISWVVQRMADIPVPVLNGDSEKHTQEDEPKTSMSKRRRVK